MLSGMKNCSTCVQRERRIDVRRIDNGARLEERKIQRKRRIYSHMESSLMQGTRSAPTRYSLGVCKVVVRYFPVTRSLVARYVLCTCKVLARYSLSTCKVLARPLQGTRSVLARHSLTLHFVPAILLWAPIQSDDTAPT